MTGCGVVKSDYADSRCPSFLGALLPADDVRTQTHLSTTPLIFIALLVTGLGACDFITGNDELSLDRRPYLGNELRMDGYYYDSGPTSEGERYIAYFFYRDGVVRYGGSSVGRDELERKVHLYGDRRYDWGVFHIDGDQIEFEKWYPGDGPYSPAYVRSGHILNDTTFTITSSRRSNGEDADQKNEVFHFRAFSPKPDSSNVFIE